MKVINLTRHGRGRDMLPNIQWYNTRKYKSWEFAEMFHSDLFNYFDCV